jgi:hypothetical protein
MSVSVFAGEPAAEPTRYSVTFEKEILCEFSAALAAAFWRYAAASGIDRDDAENAYIKLMDEAMLKCYDIMNCDTLEALGATESRLRDMKRILSEVSAEPPSIRERLTAAKSRNEETAKAEAERRSEERGKNKNTPER